MSKKINLSLYYTIRYRICLIITSVFLIIISFISKLQFMYFFSLISIFLFMIALPYWGIKTKNLVKYSLIDEESFSIVGLKNTTKFSFDEIKYAYINAIWSPLPDDKRGNFTIKIKVDKDIYSYEADYFNGVRDLVKILKLKNIPINYNTLQTEKYFES